MRYFEENCASLEHLLWQTQRFSDRAEDAAKLLEQEKKELQKQLESMAAKCHGLQQELKFVNIKFEKVSQQLKVKDRQLEQALQSNQSLVAKLNSGKKQQPAVATATILKCSCLPGSSNICDHCLLNI